MASYQHLPCHNFEAAGNTGIEKYTSTFMTWLVPMLVPCSSQWTQHTIKRETSALKVASTTPGALLLFFSFRRKSRRILPPSPRVRRCDASILPAALVEHTNTMAEKEWGFKYKLSESGTERMPVMIAHEMCDSWPDVEGWLVMNQKHRLFRRTTCWASPF